MSATGHIVGADDFQHESDQFMNWLASQSGVRISPKISVADLRAQNAGRGVVARTDIDEDEELFAIPGNVVLSVQNSKLSSTLRSELESLDLWLSLIVVMIHEYLQGEASPWFHYLRILPYHFDSLMFWSDAELGELQGSAVVEKIGKAGADSLFLEQVAPIVRANRALFPPPAGVNTYDGPDGERALLETAHRMGSLIMGYAFDIEKGEDEEEAGEDGYLTDDEEQSPKGMVPLADLLNADATRNNARLFQEEGFLIMRSIKPISTGQEIFNDYGDVPRADLLRRYGYVTDNYAQYDVVEMPLSTICQVAGQSAEPSENAKLEFLEELDLLDDGYSVARPVSGETLSDILPDELLVLLQVLNMTPDQFNQVKSKTKPPKPAPGHPEAALLRKVVEKRQTDYATTIAQDQQILANVTETERATGAPLTDSDRRGKMAVQVRIGEKEILEQVRAMLDDALVDTSEGLNKRGIQPDNAAGSKRTKF